MAAWRFMSPGARLAALKGAAKAGFTLVDVSETYGTPVPHLSRLARKHGIEFGAVVAVSPAPSAAEDKPEARQPDDGAGLIAYNVEIDKERNKALNAQTGALLLMLDEVDIVRLEEIAAEGGLTPERTAESIVQAVLDDDAEAHAA